MEHPDTEPEVGTDRLGLELNRKGKKQVWLENWMTNIQKSIHTIRHTNCLKKRITWSLSGDVGKAFDETQHLLVTLSKLETEVTLSKLEKNWNNFCN